MSVLTGIATLALAVPSATSAYAAGSGSGGGGGGGGGEETTVTNNLSVPVILVGDNPFGLDCGTVVGEPGPYVAPTGEPTTGYPVDPEAYYYVQGTNTWQAQCESALTATATVSWGDNLSGDAALVVGHPIRVEVGLLSDNPPSMTGLSVVKLDPAALDRESAYGTLATQSGSSYVANPVTPYSEVRVWDSGAQMVITDPSGAVVPGVSVAGELNSTGTVVYGFQLTPSVAGTYTITFTTSSAVTISGGNSITFNVTSSSGSSGGTTVAPAAPTNLQASPASGQVNLSWTAPADMGTGTFLGYQVYMGTAPGGEATTPVNASFITGSSYSASGLTNGTPYYFIVKAVTSAGVSPASNEASATPGTVVNPTTPPTTSGTSTVTLPSSSTGTSSTATPASGSGSGAGSAAAQGAGQPGSGGISLSASPTTVGGAKAVTYTVKVSGASGGTVLIMSGQRLVCTIHLDANGQGKCTSTRFNGNGVVTAKYLGDATHGPLSSTIRTSMVPASYWVLGSNGNVYRFGGAPNFGTLPGHQVRASNVIALVPSPDGQGYWMLGRDGGVFAFGSAHFYGSLGGKHLKGAIVGMAATPDGRGYWMLGRDGGVFTFGSAHFYGSLGGKHLNSPIVGMTASPDGKGYWLVAANGAMYRFGSAQMFGSLAGKTLASQAVGMVATADGKGYWVFTSKGAVYAFGDAKMFGSLAGKTLSSPITGMASTPDSNGYWLVARNGSVYNFGSAANFGSPRQLGTGTWVAGIAVS
jgi:hypothetical protein